MTRALLRQLLGEALDGLPEGLRRFHDDPTCGRGEGTLRVERPRGLARLLGDLAGFPPAAEAAPLVLEVRPDGAWNRWVRRVGDVELCSRQRVRGGLLLDRFGPLTLAYAPRIDGDTIVYDLRRAAFLGVPLPAFLRPRDRSSERGTAEGWEVSVEVALPVLGTMVAYRGHVRWASNAPGAEA